MMRSSAQLHATSVRGLEQIGAVLKRHVAGDGDGSPGLAHHVASAGGALKHHAQRHHQALRSHSENWGLHPSALPLLGGALLLALFVVLLLRVALGPRKRRPAPRVVLPFDMEGGASGHASGATWGQALPASISRAAAAADVATLRAWASDERCVIDARCASDASTALHLAARHGHVNVLRLLLDSGSDALCVDAALRTPLHWVAEAGHGLCVNLLLNAGADPEGRDGKGRTPLSLAEEAQHVGTARMMRLAMGRRAEAAADRGAHRRAK